MKIEKTLPPFRTGTAGTLNELKAGDWFVKDNHTGEDGPCCKTSSYNTCTNNVFVLSRSRLEPFVRWCPVVRIDLDVKWWEVTGPTKEDGEMSNEKRLTDEELQLTRGLISSAVPDGSPSDFALGHILDHIATLEASERAAKAGVDRLEAEKKELLLVVGNTAIERDALRTRLEESEAYVGQLADSLAKKMVENASAKIEPCTKDRDGDASLTERGESAVVLCQSLLDQWYPPPEPNHILTWRCSKCGAWHKKQGYHYRTVAAQVPEADEFCSDGCPFNTRESDDGYYCILGLHEKPQGERECKPGPECLLNREG